MRFFDGLFVLFFIEHNFNWWNLKNIENNQIILSYLVDDHLLITLDEWGAILVN